MFAFEIEFVAFELISCFYYINSKMGYDRWDCSLITLDKPSHIP